MARIFVIALAEVQRRSDSRESIRVPITSALLEIYGPDVEDEALANLVEAMLPIEVQALGLSDR